MLLRSGVSPWSFVPVAQNVRAPPLDLPALHMHATHEHHAHLASINTNIHNEGNKGAMNLALKRNMKRHLMLSQLTSQWEHTELSLLYLTGRTMIIRDASEGSRAAAKRQLQEVHGPCLCARCQHTLWRASEMRHAAVACKERHECPCGHMPHSKRRCGVPRHKQSRILEEDSRVHDRLLCYLYA